MATYEITSPSGEVFEITAPDDATEEQVLAYAKANIPADKPRAAPGSEPLPTFSDFLRGSAKDVVKGLITGGPVGAAIAGVGSGLKNQSLLTDRLAYKAGGAVTDALAPHVPANIAGGAGYAANVATQAIPVLAGALAGGAVKPAFEGTGKRLMQSALKPLQRDIVSGDAQRAIQTMLDEGAGVTVSGANKLQGIASNMNKKVGDLVSASTATINRAAPQDEVVDLLIKNADTANPSAGERAIMSAWDDFVANHPATMSVSQAQKIKQATYRDLERAYLSESTSARDDALKAIARGLRKAIERAIPDVKPLNARASDALNALRQVNRRVGIADNRDLAGLSPAGMNPQAMAAMLMDRSPWLKSLLARMLYSGSGPMSTALGGAAGAPLGILSGTPQ